MPMSRDEFNAMRKMGHSVEDIVAAERQATEPPPEAVQPDIQREASPMAGAVGAVGEGLSGLKGVGLGVGGLGGAMLLKRALAGRRAAPTPAAAPPAASPQPVAPAAPKPSASLVTLDAEDVAGHPEFRNYREGQQVSRRLYERVKSPELFPQPGSAASRAQGPVAAAADATARPSFSVSTGQEIPTVSATGVTISKGRAKPALKVVEGGAPGSAASRASGGTPASPTTVVDEPMVDPNKVPKWQGGKLSEAGQRHDMQYWSEGRGAHVDVEDMQQSHLLNAIKKLQTKLAGKSNPGETNVRSLENMLDELKHRVSTGAITVGDTPKAGGAAGRAARAAEAIAEADGMSGSAARRAGGGGKAALGGLAALLGMSMLSGRARAAGADQGTLDELSQGLPDMFDNPDAAGALAGMRLARQHGRPTPF